MADPTKAELFNQIAHACKIINELDKFNTSNTPNILAMIQAFQAEYKGNHIVLTESAVNTMRDSLSNLYLHGRNILEPIIQDLAILGYDSVEEETRDMLVDIYDGMEDATETIQARDITWAAETTGLATVGSNNGTGKVYRITKDQDGHDLENGFPVGDLKLKCFVDKHGGLPSGREQFILYGDGKRGLDQIDMGDVPGNKQDLYATRSADQLLPNASFDTYNATVFTAADDLAYWQFETDYSNFEIDENNYYRRRVGVESGDTPLGSALKILDNDAIYMYCPDANIQFDPTLPVFFIVRYNCEQDSCDGDLTISIGSQNETVSLTTQTGWNDLVLGVANSTKGWYTNFQDDDNGNGIKITIRLENRTTGTLLIDEILLVQPVFYEGSGCWFLVTAGATDFLRDDEFTYSDSCAETGIIQKILAREFGFYLPHTTGTPTYSDTPT
jgi:hypothetical protein